MTANTHLLLLAMLPALLGHGPGGAGGEVVALTGSAASAPVFAPRQETKVIGVEGRNVTLKCKVLQLGDKAVLWVRGTDLQILTHGQEVFTADTRISIPSSPSTTRSGAVHAYALRIDKLRSSDAGRYECQLNTDPKMSRYFDLIVVDEIEATTELVTEAEPWADLEVEVWAGRDEVKVAIGGTAELACFARVLDETLGAAPPLDIRWVRNGKPLTLQDGCAVSRVAGASYAESHLRLVGVRASDRGKYTCAVGPHVATVTLQVNEQETLGEMEAMQRDQSIAGGESIARISLPTALASLLVRFIAF